MAIYNKKISVLQTSAIIIFYISLLIDEYKIKILGGVKHEKRKVTVGNAETL